MEVAEMLSYSNRRHMERSYQLESKPSVRIGGEFSDKHLVHDQEQLSRAEVESQNYEVHIHWFGTWSCLRLVAVVGLGGSGRSWAMKTESRVTGQMVCHIQPYKFMGFCSRKLKTINTNIHLKYYQ